EAQWRQRGHDVHARVHLPARVDAASADGERRFAIEARRRGVARRRPLHRERGAAAQAAAAQLPAEAVDVDAEVEAAVATGPATGREPCVDRAIEAGREVAGVETGQ